MKGPALVGIAAIMALLVGSAAGLTCFSCMGYDSSESANPKTNNKDCAQETFVPNNVPTADMNSDEPFCYKVWSSVGKVNGGNAFTVRGVANNNKSQTLDDFVNGEMRDNRFILSVCDTDYCNGAVQQGPMGLAVMVLPALLWKLLVQ